MENLRKYIVNNFTKEEVLIVSRRLNKFCLYFLIYYFTSREALEHYLNSYGLNSKEQRLIRKAVLSLFIKNLNEERRNRK